MIINNLELLKIFRLLANNIFVIVCASFFLDKLYIRKYSDRKVYVLFYSLAILFNFIASMVGIPLINSLTSIISINLLSLSLYEVKKLQSLVNCTLFVVSAVFCDIISSIIVSSVTYSSLDVATSNEVMLFSSSVLSWILIFILLKVMTISLSENDLLNIKFKELTFFTILTATEIFITAYILSIIEYTSSGAVVLFILATFFGLNIYVSHLLNVVSKSNALQYNLELAEQQNILQLKYYNELIRKQEQSQQVIHDVKKHIITLEGLFRSNDGKKADEYYKDFCYTLDKLEFAFNCDNKIVSIIVDNKLTIAKDNSIDFKIYIEDMSFDFMSDLDITTIFGNLLDNSFEECSFASDNDNKWVKLIVEKRNDFIFICISNPIFSDVESIDGELNTIKEGHKGIGLVNVNDAVAKYNGNLLAEIKNSEFISSITIPITLD